MIIWSFGLLLLAIDWESLANIPWPRSFRNWEWIDLCLLSENSSIVALFILLLHLFLPLLIHYTWGATSFLLKKKLIIENLMSLTEHDMQEHSKRLFVIGFKFLSFKQTLTRSNNTNPSASLGFTVELSNNWRPVSVPITKAKIILVLRVMRIPCML